MAGETGPNDPGGRRPREKVRELQRRLWAGAKRAPGRRFHALYDQIWRGDVLRGAWERVRRNRGAAGVDSQSIRDVEQGGVESFLEGLGNELRTGEYRPSLVRRRYIPKADGKKRPLGIPTVRDRVAQMAAKLVLWRRHSTPLGTLVRYADDFVVMCRTAKDCERAEGRIREILGRLGLELHPDKTRRVELYDGKEGFDFLGCHLHKRLSGKLWEQGTRLYFLQRWPSPRSMRRVRQRVKELTPRSRCHADIRDVIADLNPVLRGWGNYFRTGNAARRFNQLDSYVWRRLRGLRVKRKGRQLRAAEVVRWTRDYFHNLGLHRLRGTVRYPEQPFWRQESA